MRLLQDDIADLRAELERCAAIFERYAALHYAKRTPEAKDKAMANEAHANRIRTLLERIR